jgi:3-oxoacyl-[acyl-carrier-protein] synthase III
MIDIIEIKSFLPNKKINTYKKFKKNYKKDFFVNKIGSTHVRRISTHNKEAVVEMCIKAFQKLKKKNIKKIKTIILCTQNPDYDGLPHNSAIIHNKLKKIDKNIDDNVACFDISLGCSGYIYCLKIIESFLKPGEQGLIFTCDPYSRIIEPNDHNTELLFGDAATVSLVNHNKFKTKLNYEFHTYGEHFQDLIKKNKILYMNGRNIFNFVLSKIPYLLKDFLKKNKINVNHVKNFYFHQGSKYIIESIAKKMHLKKSQTPILLDQIGNTVSSSIPLTMEFSNYKKRKKPFILCGFGVGLSVSLCLII